MNRHILAIFNQKGGTAKTTTAVQLASSFASKGKRVLLVDMDPQANATLNLGVNASAVERTAYDVLVREEPLQNVIVSTPLETLHLVPSNVGLSKTDINLADGYEKQLRLRKALEPFRHHYDYVIIDCPPSYGFLPINALCASTHVLIPITAQYFSLEGLKQVTDSLEAIKHSLNPELEIAGILFCLVNLRLRATPICRELVQQHFPGQLLNSFIRFCPRLSESTAVGRSIFSFAPASKGALDYEALSGELVTRLDSTSVATRRGVFHGA